MTVPASHTGFDFFEPFRLARAHNSANPALHRTRRWGLRGVRATADG